MVSRLWIINSHACISQRGRRVYLEGLLDIAVLQHCLTHVNSLDHAPHECKRMTVVHRLKGAGGMHPGQQKLQGEASLTLAASSFLLLEDAAFAALCRLL